MAFNLKSFSVFFFFLIIISSSHCFNPKLFNVSLPEISFTTDWSPAGATWYGSPTGAGSDGGACGYGSAVEQPPFSAMISAGGPSLFESGKGCGTCYEVKCTSNVACSGSPVTVTITDQCPECTSESYHFDLSGSAFGAMAKPNQAGQLRNAGRIQVQFRRVKCNYPGTTMSIKVDPGSTSSYIAFIIEFVDGDGSLKMVEIHQNGERTSVWYPMQQSWGALWKFQFGSLSKPPMSLRLTAESGETLVLNEVIPNGWQPGHIYRSHVNFKSSNFSII